MRWFATVLCCWATDKRRCWLQVRQLTCCDEGCRNTSVTFKYRTWSTCDPHTVSICQHLSTSVHLQGREEITQTKPMPLVSLGGLCDLRWSQFANPECARDLASPKGPVACLNSRAWAPDPQGRNLKKPQEHVLKMSQVFSSILKNWLHIHVFCRHHQNIIIFVICMHNFCRPRAAGNELQQRSTDLQLQWGLYRAVLDCDYCCSVQLSQTASKSQQTSWCHHASWHLYRWKCDSVWANDRQEDATGKY